MVKKLIEIMTVEMGMAIVVAVVVYLIKIQILFDINDVRLH